MTVPRRVAPLLLSAALAAATCVLAPAIDAHAADDCLPSIGTQQPVLLVHGLFGSARTWGDDGTAGSTFKALHDGIPHSYVEAFDYEKTNTQWVDAPNNGPRLAQRIACVAASSRAHNGPGKVVLVGHSMGGLMIRYAASRTINGRKLGDDIAMAATIGTPNTGSGWANIASGVLGLLCRSLRITGSFSGIKPGSTCVPSAFDGLRDHSPQIDELPQLPNGIPLLAVSGDEGLSFRVLRVPYYQSTQSDLVVSKTSAQKSQRSINGVGGVRNIECSADVTAGFFAPCSHSPLTHNADALRAITDAVEKYQRQQVISPFVLKWYVHGGGLDIKSDYTATQTTSVGPCTPDAVVDSEMCQQTASLELTATPDGLKATVVHVSYETWGGRKPPAGFTPTDNFGTTIGLTFYIKKVKDDEIIVYRDGGAPLPYCDPHGPSAAAGDCGA